MPIAAAGVLVAATALGDCRLAFSFAWALLAAGLTNPMPPRAPTPDPNGRREPTTVCQVMDRRDSFEHWPHPIVMIRLSDFQLLDKPPLAMTCD